MSDPWWGEAHVKEVIAGLKLAKRDCRVCGGKKIYYVPFSKTIQRQCSSCHQIDEAIMMIQNMHAVIIMLGITAKLPKEDPW